MTTNDDTHDHMIACDDLTMAMTTNDGTGGIVTMTTIGTMTPIIISPSPSPTSPHHIITHHHHHLDHQTDHIATHDHDAHHHRHLGAEICSSGTLDPCSRGENLDQTREWLCEVATYRCSRNQKPENAKCTKRVCFGSGCVFFKGMMRNHSATDLASGCCRVINLRQPPAPSGLFGTLRAVR